MNNEELPDAALIMVSELNGFSRICLRKEVKGGLSHPNSKPHMPIMVLTVVGFLVPIPLEGKYLNWTGKRRNCVTDIQRKNVW